MKYKVAVIEDEEYLRRGLILTTDWEALGCYVVGEFGSPAAALNQLPTLHPDIVLSDIRMPGINGLEMIQALQKELNCVYIVISGFDDFTYAQQSIELGVMGYLLKPIDDDELARTIRKATAILEKRQPAAPAENEIGEGALYHSFEYQAETAKDHFLQKALALIQTRYNQDDISVKWLAHELNASESYLYKLFKVKTSYTIHDWITHYRMKLAMKLMKDAQLRIYEIAREVGYRDVRHFSSVFKKHFNLTPTEYRGD